MRDIPVRLTGDELDTITAALQVLHDRTPSIWNENRKDIARLIEKLEKRQESLHRRILITMEIK